MASNIARHAVFVYGTLKSGEPNHRLLVDPSNGLANFVGKAVTAHKYPLVIASRFNIPFLLHCKGHGHNVHGEIYSVDDQMLHVLDQLENHPDYYERLKENVLLQDSERVSPEMEVWIYFFRQYKSSIFELPHMENYSSLGSHGLPYVERYNREPGGEYIVDVRDV